MFIFEDPANLDRDWYLGDERKHLEHISKKLLQCLSNHHLIGIQFLFENFMKKRGGAILNQDEDMNMPIQVCTFLRSFKDQVSTECPILIICPENSLCKWHYHITEVGWTPKVILSENTDPCEVYLLTFESLKFSEQFLDSDLFTVVVDEMDEVATKLIIRKLNGFHIGLTVRNFYANPDPKTKWFMLNWASPGCVGKMNDFFRIDRLHTMAFADNYRFWWSRLTWKFCESFERPSEEDLQDYQQKLQEWGETYEIKTSHSHKVRKSKRKIKIKNEDPEIEVKEESVELKTEEPTDRVDPSTSNSNRKRKSNSSVSHLDAKKKIAILYSSEEEEASEQTRTIREGSGNEIEEKCIGSDGETDRPVKVGSSDSYEVLNNLISPSKVNKAQILDSDDEDPILAIMGFKKQGPSKSYSTSAKLSSRSSESDSDVSNDILKTKSECSRYYRSQQISQIVDNLSDIEENRKEESDGEDFFSELISGKN